MGPLDSLSSTPSTTPQAPAATSLPLPFVLTTLTHQTPVLRITGHTCSFIKHPLIMQLPRELPLVGLPFCRLLASPRHSLPHSRFEMLLPHSDRFLPGTCPPSRLFWMDLA